jgi:phosphate transport system permease protein
VTTRDKLGRDRRISARRLALDMGTRLTVSMAGLLVILGMGGILYFLVQETLPLLASAHISPAGSVVLPGHSPPVLSGVVSGGEGVWQVRRDGLGQRKWFGVPSPALQTFPVVGCEPLTHAHHARASDSLAAIDASGRLCLTRLPFARSPGDAAPASPLWRSQPYTGIVPEGPVRALSHAVTGQTAVVAMISAEGALWVYWLDVATGCLLARAHPAGVRGEQVLLSDDGAWLYLAEENGDLGLWKVGARGLVKASGVNGALLNAAPGALALLPGGASMLAGYEDGSIRQWSLVRDPETGVRHLALIRTFDALPQPVRQILTERRRHAFVALGDGGLVGLYFATSGQRHLLQQVDTPSASIWALEDSGRVLLAFGPGGQVGRFRLELPYPEASGPLLWKKTWYQHHSAPDWLWQSWAFGTEVEPKFSLVPLVAGTFKAALWAMVFSLPLALSAAIYTGFFMPGAMRRRVKPLIELMEAVPTVLVGFVAVLWLGPLIEAHLLAIVLTLLVMPLALLLTGFGWARLFLPRRVTPPEGWHFLSLMPVVIGVVVLCFLAGGQIESWWFAEGFSTELARWLGVDFQQHNTLVVGLAMGFAVIPSIYSVSEDAIHAVPRSLKEGSLALGATAWQTLYRVVLLTASPGIFSAVMIGLGRALGEAMIVLMVTGNTPLTSMNPLEGLRSLSANLLLEMPEASVGNVHYRILVLSALLLFLLTFVLNTVAELVRQHLRRKYASL